MKVLKNLDPNSKSNFLPKSLIDKVSYYEDTKFLSSILNNNQNNEEIKVVNELDKMSSISSLNSNYVNNLKVIKEVTEIDSINESKWSNSLIINKQIEININEIKKSNFDKKNLNLKKKRKNKKINSNKKKWNLKYKINTIKHKLTKNSLHKTIIKKYNDMLIKNTNNSSIIKFFKKTNFYKLKSKDKSLKRIKKIK